MNRVTSHDVIPLEQSGRGTYRLRQTNQAVASRERHFVRIRKTIPDTRTAGRRGRTGRSDTATDVREKNRGIRFKCLLPQTENEIHTVADREQLPGSSRGMLVSPKFASYNPASVRQRRRASEMAPTRLVDRAPPVMGVSSEGP